MILKRIKLQNFAQHRNLDVTLNGNLVGILGTNGCGKSNLLNAIRFAFTGDMDDTKESWVSYGLTGTDARGFVELWFQAHGKEGYIKRALHSQTRTFTYGEDKYKKDAEIDKALQELFGMDKDMLRNLTFIRQGELQSLLFGKPAAREANFIKIFGLGHTEAVRDLLMSKIEILTKLAVDVTAALDEQRSNLKAQTDGLPALEKAAEGLDKYQQEWTLATRTKVGLDELHGKFTRLAQLEDMVDTLQTAIAATQSKPYANPNEAAMHKQQLEKARADAIKAAEQAETRKRREQLLVDIGQANAEIQRISGELTASSALAATLPDAAGLAAMDAQIVTKEAGDAVRTEYSAAIVKRAGLKSEFDSIKFHTKEEFQAAKKRSEDAIEARGKVVANYERLHNALNDLRLLKDGIDCPLCLSKVASVDAIKAILTPQFELAKQANDAAGAEVTAATAAERALEKSEQELRDRQSAVFRELHSLDTQIAGLQARIDAADAIPTPLAELKELQTRLKLRASLDTQIAQGRATVAQLESSNQIRKEQLDRTPEPTEVIVTPDAHAVKGLEDWLAQHERVMADMNQDLGRIQSTETEIRKLHEELKDVAPVTPEMTAAVADAAAKAEALWKAANEASGRLNQARITVQTVKARVAELEAGQEKTAKITKLIAQFKKVREVLERRNLPLTFIQQYFTRIIPMVQAHLSAVGANYLIRPDATEPVSLIFDRTDGSAVGLPVDKLSGGQKVRLVVAFLFALHELMSSKMGFLVLDEPTVFLDDAGVESFGELLSQLVVRLHSADMQVLISTHEQSLKSQFISSVQL